jgi:hypothetical protein
VFYKTLRIFPLLGGAGNDVTLSLQNAEEKKGVSNTSSTTIIFGLEMSGSILITKKILFVPNLQQVIQLEKWGLL